MQRIQPIPKTRFQNGCLQDGKDSARGSMRSAPSGKEDDPFGPVQLGPLRPLKASAEPFHPHIVATSPMKRMVNMPMSPGPSQLGVIHLQKHGKNVWRCFDFAAIVRGFPKPTDHDQSCKPLGSSQHQPILPAEWRCDRPAQMTVTSKVRKIDRSLVFSTTITSDLRMTSSV